MDCFMFLVLINVLLGFMGKGDFYKVFDGVLICRGFDEVVDFVWNGVQIIYFRLFVYVLQGVFFINFVWDYVIKVGCFFGFGFEGIWMYIGDLQVVEVVEDFIVECGYC